MARETIRNSSVSLTEVNLVQLAAFNTRLGWFGVVHNGSVLVGLKFGFATRRQLVDRFTDSLDRAGRTDWVSPKIDAPYDGFSNQEHFWQQRFVEYADGKRVCFDDVEIDDVGRTVFQARVLKVCRAIPYGSTMAYGKLASQSGFPNAARAVGSAMKSNRFPIIIPCHRVVASNGIGRFSASDGTSTKRKLLAMEGYFDCE